MTELLQAQTRLAYERAKFEDEETQLRENRAAAERLYYMTRSLFMSFTQRRHDHLKSFAAAVDAAGEKS